MKQSVKRLAIAIAVSAVFVAELTLDAHADQSITLRSGNGTIGSQDAQLHFLAYGAFGNITPTAADFAAVQTGAFAHIVTPFGTYVQKLPSDPLAQWVATTSTLSGGSALYAIPFTVTDSVIGSASLDLGYAVDNALNGVYINGMPISNNPLDGDYHGEYYVLRSDIASLLKPNVVNWLYLNAADYGTLAAFVFSANITIQGGTPAAPTISPNVGGNMGQVSVTVIGSGFEGSSGPGRPGATLTLSGTGPTITATNVTVTSPNILTGTFDLTNATPGARTVSVINPDKTSTVLANAFTIQAGGGANLQIKKIGNAAVAGYNETFFITVTNNGNVDAGITPINEILEPWFTYVAANPTPTSTQVETNPIVTNVSSNYVWTLEWDLPSVPAGTSTTISYTVFLNPDFPNDGVVHGPACLEQKATACRNQFISCVNFLGGDAKSCVVKATPGGVKKILVDCAAPIAACVAVRVACAAIGHDECVLAAYNARFAKDPNELVGPTGYGPQEWFNPSPPLQYALSFTNEPTATKAAVNVYTTDTFDPTKFQVDTLTVAGIIIGNTSFTPPSIPLLTKPFTHDIDLRPAQDVIVRVNATLDPTTNQVNVNFLSLDPATGMPPTDPLAGFLGPAAGGTVLFTVAPQPGYVTGTTISDEGSVIFDTNAPIFTPVYTNTVDIDPPASKVTALPASEPSTFTVSWSGTDKGSGIVTYTIYVSDNGGAFTPWQSAVALTSASYTGVAGHTYGFYSIATDGAGNVEAAKTTAEASTETALAPQITSISPTYGAPAAFINIAGTNFGATQSNSSVIVGDSFAQVIAWSDAAITVRVPSRAATGNITVTSGGETSNGAAFTFFGEPSITNLSVSSGPIGTSVTINGNNLLDGGNKAAVTFNETPAAISSDTASQIQVTVPSGATSGPVRILVNGVLVLSPTSFTVSPLPQITGLTPNYGAPAALIKIAGTDFGASQSNGSVTVGGAPSRVVSWSNTLIVIQVPSRATTGNIVVTSAGEASNGAPFTFQPYPAIAAVSPLSGAVGTPVTITGAGLLDEENKAIVTFNGTPATIISQSSTSIQVNVPAGAANGPVSVRVNGDTVKSPSSFTVIAPHIGTINPGYGAPAALIGITGTGFGATQGSSYVTINGALCGVTAWSDTSITIRVPSNASTGNLVVRVSGESSNGETFTFFPYPTIAAVSPSSGPVGTPVIITGSNLLDGGNNATVTFNGIPAAISNDSSGSIQVTVPTGATSGRVLVRVNGVTLVDPTNFVVTPPTP